MPKYSDSMSTLLISRSLMPPLNSDRPVTLSMLMKRKKTRIVSKRAVRARRFINTGAFGLCVG